MEHHRRPTRSQPQKGLMAFFSNATIGRENAIQQRQRASPPPVESGQAPTRDYRVDHLQDPHRRKTPATTSCRAPPIPPGRASPWSGASPRHIARGGKRLPGARLDARQCARQCALLPIDQWRYMPQPIIPHCIANSAHCPGPLRPALQAARRAAVPTTATPALGRARSGPPKSAFRHAVARGAPSSDPRISGCPSGVHERRFLLPFLLGKISTRPSLSPSAACQILKRASLLI